MTQDIVSLIFEKLGFLGLVCIAIYFVSRKLTQQYEDRIKALENHVLDCNKDAISLRSQVVALQAGIIADLRTRLGSRDEHAGEAAK